MSAMAMFRLQSPDAGFRVGDNLGVTERWKQINLRSMAPKPCHSGLL
jgi:hypothetical protein